jgi:RNA polymerase sigma factor (sigma-70 family)
MQNAAEVDEEHRLAQRFCQGDRTALDILFRRYYQRLCRDAQRFVSADDAEEVVQDIFAALLARKQQWSVHTTVRQYLHSAVRNRARDRLARSQRVVHGHDASDHDSLFASRYNGTPEDGVLLEELADLIEAGLTSCPTRVREVLRLSATMRRYADIGRVLGIQSGTVHTLLARGRRRMRVYLRRHGWLHEENSESDDPLVSQRNHRQSTVPSVSRSPPDTRGFPATTAGDLHPSPHTTLSAYHAINMDSFSIAPAVYPLLGCVQRLLFV